MSQGILAYASRVIFTPYDISGNLGASVTLQVDSISRESETNMADMTNFESNGYAEDAPTFVRTHFNFSGIVDPGQSWEVVSDTLLSKFMAKLDFYLAKSTLVANPQLYTGLKCIVENGTTKSDVKEGMMKFSCKLRVIGKPTRAGTDVVSVSGNVS